ncbi:MAG TPA: 30S ribosomal protein S5 [Candidatus Woesearchaeota archaeon]|nr:30S ribosomal protein S5 [Candidatus Woesearchaeota archaeon]
MRRDRDQGPRLEDWIPKTGIGKKVKSGEIKSIDEIIDNGIKIKEHEIVDTLLPDLEMDLILVGQSKGKFGGGKRRAFKQTQKKTSEGSKIKFTSIAIIGNKNGYVGLGSGSSNETVPAKTKAIRNAKLNIIRIKRGCGSWECACGTPHSVPFTIEGKCGSVKIVIKPAPKGLGLATSNEVKKILELAGIKDAWSKSSGQTSTRQNLAYACFEAIKSLNLMKTRSKFDRFSGLEKGSLEKQIKTE